MASCHKDKYGNQIKIGDLVNVSFFKLTRRGTGFGYRKGIVVSLNSGSKAKIFLIDEPQEFVEEYAHDFEVISLRGDES